MCHRNEKSIPIAPFSIFTLLGLTSHGSLYHYTSNVCSLEWLSYFVWYLDVSDTSPLFLLHVTVGWGSPMTIALKKANLPAKTRQQLRKRLNFKLTAEETSIIDSYNLIKQ